MSATRHILVVDDERDMEPLMKQKFRSEIRGGTLAFAFARSGEEALAILRVAPPDFMMILSDINMPGMSGLELLTKVRAEYTHLPVVMISAYGDAETQRQARDLGASDFVSKPLDFERLRRHLLGTAE